MELGHQHKYSVSVVTICFNNLSELQSTCSSIDVQTTPPLEHIIVNGSTDDSIKIWSETTHQPDYRKFIHERDKGISDAFNKGIRASSGDLIVLLNSADTFSHQNVIGNAIAAFEKDTDLQWIHAKYKFQRGGLWVTLGKPHDPTLIYRGMRAICHQTMFVKRGLYEKYGLYETDLKLAMDFDFLVRIRDEKFAFLDEVMVTFAPGGASALNIRKGLDENTKIINNRIGFSTRHHLWKIRILILSTLLTSSLGKRLYKLKVWLKLENA